MMRFWAILLVGSLWNLTGWTAEREVACWDFRSAQETLGWQVGGNIQDLRVSDGALKGIFTGRDPILFSPTMDIPMKKGLILEIRMKSAVELTGELYFTDTHEGRFGGFSAEKRRTWKIYGDGEWHTYRIRPGWNGLSKILKLRIDPGSPIAEYWGKESFAMAWVKVIDLDYDSLRPSVPQWDFTQENTAEWKLADGRGEKTSQGWVFAADSEKEGFPTLESAPIRLEKGKLGNWCTVEMAVSAGNTGKLVVEKEEWKKPLEITFPLRADGQMHRYNVPLYGMERVSSEICFFRLQPSDSPTAQGTVQSLALGRQPQGAAQLDLKTVGLSDAINRVGQKLSVELTITNTGGETAENVTVSAWKLPDGMRLTSPKDAGEVGPLIPFVPHLCRFSLVAEKAVPAGSEMEITVSWKNGEDVSVKAPVEVLPSLHLPKADYVPVPKPVASEYEIGALYFPGWAKASAWEKIFADPIRKPILGWYDEANPEVIDWQIKWALENGIQYFLVDWYWNRGSQSLDHWVRGFYQTRYKSMFKWAMMWANHNGPGSHSEEDQAAVTQFWIENYFQTPEYYTLEGKPVVMIWSPDGMDRDVREIYRQKGVELAKGEGVKKLLDLSQKMAKEAGLKGIYFIAMKWPEASTRGEDLQWLKDAGFEMTTIYHFMHHGNKAKNPKYFDFDLVVEANIPFLEGMYEQREILPFLPNLSTGWDSRPWHGLRQTVIYGRTVEKFRQLCEDTKRFCDAKGIRNVCLAPLNEWGEGSYAEPNKEFGFGMYEAVRDTFCQKPAEGWPLNYAPADVGLGPYDLRFPTLEEKHRTRWDFSDSTQGWHSNGKDFQAENGKLLLKTTSNDPILSVSLGMVFADSWKKVRVRMKVTKTDGTAVAPSGVQLFWATPFVPISESSSVRLPLQTNGEFHDYIFPVASSEYWNGQIQSLRLDPCNEAGCQVEIEEVELQP